MIRPRPKLAVYLRVSSQTQKNEETIQRQIENFKQAEARLLAEYDLVIRYPHSDQTNPENRLFCDPGYNLEALDPNSALSDLLNRCCRGEVAAIFVSEIDRLCRSRSAEFRGKIKDILDRYNIKIITKNGEIPLGILFELLSSVSAEDKRGTMLKLHEGKIFRVVQEGRPPSGSNPYGYSWSRLKKTWSIVQDEAKMIRSALGLTIGKVYEDMPPEIAALARANPSGLSDPKVVEALNSAGFTMLAYYERNNLKKPMQRNPTGKIHESYLGGLFRDDRYRGKYRVWLKEPHQVGKFEFKDLERENKKEIIIPLPPIIESDADWNELKARRFSRQVHSKRNVNHEYLLKDLLVCSVCGVRLSARPKWGRKLRKSDGIWSEYKPTLYYVCKRKRRVSGFRCSATRCHAAPKTDSLIWNEVKGYLLNPQKIQAINQSTKEISAPPSLESIERNYGELGEKISILTNERERLTTLVLKQVFNESDFIREQSRIESEVRGIEKLRKTVFRQIESTKKLLSETLPVDVEKIRTQVEGRLEELTFEERRQVVLILVKAVTISPDGGMKVSLKPVSPMRGEPITPRLS